MTVAEFTKKEDAFVSLHSIYESKTTIQHWQLRDLIACPNNRREIIHVYGINVRSYNTKTREDTTILSDLSFPPTSLAANHGYIAAGGQKSELVVLQQGFDWNEQNLQARLGGSINNSMCIASIPNGTPTREPPCSNDDNTHQAAETMILISNNDKTVKVYNLPSLEKTSMIHLPTCVNYATVSPDGRRMVAVGDTPDVFLFEVANNGTFHQVATLTATNDAGFSCAWNQWSDKFAVASQDGFVSIWDARNSRKIAKIQTQQSVNNGQGPGAARSVKFSPSGPIDLLAFSEHQNRVHILDARTFDVSQDIAVDSIVRRAITDVLYEGDDVTTHSRLSAQSDVTLETSTIPLPSPSMLMDVNIAGLCFAPDSSALFVGTESFILEYDIESIRRRSFGISSLL